MRGEINTLTMKQKRYPGWVTYPSLRPVRFLPQKTDHNGSWGMGFKMNKFNRNNFLPL